MRRLRPPRLEDSGAPSLLFGHVPNKGRHLLDGMAGCHFGGGRVVAAGGIYSRGKTWDERPKGCFRAHTGWLFSPAHRTVLLVYFGRQRMVPLTDNVLRKSFESHGWRFNGRKAGLPPKFHPTERPSFSLVITWLGFTMEEPGLDPRTRWPARFSANGKRSVRDTLPQLKYPKADFQRAFNRMFDNDPRRFASAADSTC